METPHALMLSENDNVASVLADVAEGANVLVRFGGRSRTVQASERIPFAFKMALTDISKGSGVYKYGECIGLASKDIHQGQLVHIHNIEGARGRGDLAR